LSSKGEVEGGERREERERRTRETENKMVM
jgi:hypothetical protein